ncbi:Dimethyl-sulfide monooxygenase [Talaromyces pinophilus]|nr:Dimethyl-sulfide monooxygenase [Talaromyces pinophilus]
MLLEFLTSGDQRENQMAPSENRAQKSLLLNAFVEICSGHQSPDLWRRPDDESWRFNDVHHWIELAKLLEEAKFYGIFIADVLGGHDVYKGRHNLDPAIVSGAQWPVNEPLAVVPAMAAATKNIGFGVTVATTYEQPYHLARRLSTVDHLTNGRQIVSGYLDSAARNLGLSEQPQHDDRYAIAEEYVKVTYKLWESSWRDDAVVRDRKYYTVPGPHICQPSPQRTPLILQAGTSKAGKLLAAQRAEAIFVGGHSPSVVSQNIAKIRELAKTRFGRDPRSLKVLALFCPVLGRTEEEAQKKFADYRNIGSVEGALALFGGWTGIDLNQYDDDQELRHAESNAIKSAVEAWSKASPGVAKRTKITVAQHTTVGGLGMTSVGTPEQVYALKPGSFVDIIELLLPDLRRRGLFWNDYAVDGGTYRENFSGKKG